jgi:Chaperone of endosialidase
MKTMARLLSLILTFTWISLAAHRTEAVVPPPDGGYPGFNTAEGQNALLSLGTGVANTAVGWRSLQTDTDGNYNTSVGAGTLLFNDTGNANVAIGTAALLFNTVGTENTAVGVAALLNNDATGNGVGSFNAAFGAYALQNNTDGQANAAFGNYALSSNTTGFTNTAIGLGAMLNNLEGSNNTAIGFDAMLSNTFGNQNTATGWNALYFNTIGHFNTANGLNALVANTEGLSNTALGWGALLNNETGSNNTASGVRAGQDITGNFNICIGSQVSGLAGESNTIRIGDNLSGQTGDSACYIGGIHNQVTANGLTVLVNANGKLGTTVSSRRFKEEIEPLDKASEVLFGLRPVSFRYKKEFDPLGVRQFGLVAEEVEKLNPDLVGRDVDGKATAVRYDQINAMLLNEFLKEHRKNEEQAATIARLEQRIEDLAAGLQKVSAQLAVGNTRSQGIASDQ